MLVTAFILIVMTLLGCGEALGRSMSDIGDELRFASAEISKPSGESAEVVTEVLHADRSALATLVGFTL